MVIFVPIVKVWITPLSDLYSLWAPYSIYLLDFFVGSFFFVNIDLCVSMIISLRPSLSKNTQTLQLRTYSLISPIITIWSPIFQEYISSSMSIIKDALGKSILFLFFNKWDFDNRSRLCILLIMGGMLCRS